MKTILRYRCFTPAVNAKSYITNTLNRIYSADAYRQPVRITKLLLLLLLFCSACSHNNDQTGNDGLTTQPVTRFEKIKWNEKKDENYIYRKQMVSNLLTQYHWAGIKKDSLIQMLGQPDDIEEGIFIYNYENKPFLGGLGTTIKALVFEIAPDSTVKMARLNDGGWD